MGRGAAVGGVGGLGFLIIVVLYLLLGGDPAQLVEQMPQAGGPSASTTTGPAPPGQEELADFVSVVLADTEDTWNPIFASIGRQYEEPKLVLFTDQVRSACGMAGAAMGPFYCPGDNKLYIDLSFYDELHRRFRAPGDLEEALNAASAIGDDRIQRKSTGRVVPDSFTHGSSAQRVKWFRFGFESGDVAA
jgi:predicted metalloprotease